MKGIDQLLRTNRTAKIAEIVLVFGVGGLIIWIGSLLVGENVLAFQGVISIANIVALLLVWAGLRLRGQSCEHFGFTLQFKGWGPIWKTFLKSLVVFLAATFAFVMGAIVMGAILGRPEQADLSVYEFLKGNLPVFVVSMVSIYLTASFGVEVIYRGFLIHRIEELGGGGKGTLYFAVILSSLVFGLIHSGWGLTGMVQTTFGGLALAICYLAFGRRLWINILAHGYMDTLLIVPLYFAEG